MQVTIVTAESEEEAIRYCQMYRFGTPDAVREVDSGDEYTRAWMCFESAADAEQWDAQK